MLCELFKLYINPQLVCRCQLPTANRLRDAGHRALGKREKFLCINISQVKINFEMSGVMGKFDKGIYDVSIDFRHADRI